MDCEKKLELLQKADAHRYQHLDFAARMFSHNLRSPLAGIKMLVPLLERSNPEEKDEIFGHIGQALELLMRNVEDLSTTMLDYRHLQEPPAPTNLQQLLNSSLATAGIENLEVKTDLNQCPDIICRRAMMETAFAEILKNSWQYRHPGRKPVLEVKSHRDKGFCLISFEDNSRGIDLEAHAGDLFKMYKQKQPYLPQEAAGKGLFRVKNIVEIQGGKVALESTAGQGTKIILQLPAEEIIH